MALKVMGSKILENIAQGLGLEQEYFANELSEDHVLYINSYPACPDPTSTIGLAKHTDPSLITILHSSHVPGLQLFMDGKCLGVDTPPDSFLVFGGNMLEVVSNGILKAPTHIVRNATEARISEAFFISPSKEYIIEPAKSILESENSLPLYRSFKYEEFFDTFKNGSGDRHTVLEKEFKMAHE
ncbi:protein DOWNY MILDEW RESISTANCE 6-like [Silene latifolia]|uniref:protein DOWNY MILDEW RESISTANCE 6-like n=1 Tax=Silene latifolia TaxID=37657 RepID=UPI003D7851AB